MLPLDEEHDADHDDGSNDADDNDERKKKETSGSASVTKRTRSKQKSKDTAPDVVTCINTYFHVINVYMCQKNRSLVMDLGRPPNEGKFGQSYKSTPTCVRSFAQPIP